MNHAVTNLLGFDPSKKNEYDYKGILKNSKRTIADQKLYVRIGDVNSLEDLLAKKINVAENIEDQIWQQK